jgi:hypothetical protein
MILFVLCSTAYAANYRFSVPQVDMNCYIQPDGSVRIVYDITFENKPGAHAIDVVDIGTPNRKYNISNMKASLDGHPLSSIRKSTYIPIGVEVPLKGYSIPGGQSGKFHFEFTMPKMVWQDTTNPENASFQITPTWFDENLVVGSTQLNIAVHMLEGIKPEEMLWQFKDKQFSNRVLFQGRAVAVWQVTHRFTGPYKVGMSFPKRGLTSIEKMTPFKLLVKWFTERPEVRFIAGCIFYILFGIIFFRATGGTGWSVFFIVCGGLLYLFIKQPAAQLWAFPALAAFFILTSLIPRKKGTYLPAIAEIEAGRIKRGLTAPEAAVLLELPLNKVLTLTLFGLLKKGVLAQTKQEPLTVDIHDDYRSSRKFAEYSKNPPKLRRLIAQERGTVIRKYEEAFLATIEANRGKSVTQTDYGVAMRLLIQSVVKKMGGYDPVVTKGYYQSIIMKALHSAKSIGEIPLKEKTIDKNLEWILMDDDYPTILTGRGYGYRPPWGRTGGWGGGGSTPSGGKIPTPASSKTSLGEVTSSFAGWTQNTMNDVAGAITPGSLDLPSASKGIVNLSGFDKVTGDVFEAMADSMASGGGGGGGGCACAGCACACACAGGGR